MLTQRHWRTVGVVTLTLSFFMALYGRGIDLRDSVVFFGVYWGIFFVLIIVTLWMAVLDFRYIMLQYRLGKREIFLDTIGNEDFRRLLRDAQDPPREDEKDSPPREQGQ